MGGGIGVNEHAFGGEVLGAVAGGRLVMVEKCITSDSSIKTEDLREIHP